MSAEHVIVDGRELTAFDLPPEPGCPMLGKEYRVQVGDHFITVERGYCPTPIDWVALATRKIVRCCDE